MKHDDTHYALALLERLGDPPRANPQDRELLQLLEALDDAADTTGLHVASGTVVDSAGRTVARLTEARDRTALFSVEAEGAR